jgi:hypothetical protein
LAYWPFRLTSWPHYLTIWLLGSTSDFLAQYLTSWLWLARLNIWPSDFGQIGLRKISKNHNFFYCLLFFSLLWNEKLCKQNLNMIVRFCPTIQMRCMSGLRKISKKSKKILLLVVVQYFMKRKTVKTEFKYDH